ncbi:MAG: NAD(P)/FAD-dependent oxidoreductase [Anaerolineae bacterium]|nr:NAD(P)/FAD-dependent oxidoreductase [Anaerolineae bacterium]
MTRHRIIVVGGGSAGLMAAGQAAAQGVETLLLEKMQRPARKLRITGKGRCNLTNVAPLTEFMVRFGRNGRFLRQAFTQFFTDDLIHFFQELGIQTVVERGGRVFPASNQAQDVVDTLVRWTQDQGVTIHTGETVNQLLVQDGCIAGAKVRAKDTIYEGDAVIVATGGASYPATGSTGDGYRLAKAAGHTIVPVRPALVPLETAGDVASRLQGLGLKNVKVSIWVNGTQQTEAFGEMMFTHLGVSGPIILTLSKLVVDALDEKKRVSLSIDLKPALDENKLDARLLYDLDKFGKRHYQNLLKELLPVKLIPICIELTGIPAHKAGHQITAQERKQLRTWLKDFRLEVSGYRPFNEAIVTAGGVSTQEIDPHTMASRLVPGLYFAGELIDVDADTGGYNLQAAFSTGWVAGRCAAQFVAGKEEEG